MGREIWYYLVTNAFYSTEEFITQLGCCLVILTTELYTVKND